MAGRLGDISKEIMEKIIPFRNVEHEGRKIKTNSGEKNGPKAMRISKAGRRKSFKKGVACDDESARVRGRDSRSVCMISSDQLM